LARLITKTLGDSIIVPTKKNLTMANNMIQYGVDRFSDRKSGHPDQNSTPFNSGITITGNSKMKQIELTQGKVALVDDEDFEWLNKWKWCSQNSGRKTYAMRSVYIGKKHFTVRMHREITKANKGQEVDHKDHNGLNNQRNNLRICSHRENMFNERARQNTTSKYKGVYYEKLIGKWRPQINILGKVIHLGSFESEVQAATVYDLAAKKHFGEFACLNFPEK
jgi:hypothetical protein